jgi:anti-anti-sigma regulatory factor
MSVDECMSEQDLKSELQQDMKTEMAVQQAAQAGAEATQAATQAPGSMDRRSTKDRRSSITVRSLPGGVVVALCGDHELSTKPQLLEALSHVRREQRVVIDLQRCTFVDSTIIGAILAAFQAGGSEEPNLSVVLPDDTSYVYRALSVIGLSDVVPAYLSAEAALGVTADRVVARVK